VSLRTPVAGSTYVVKVMNYKERERERKGQGSLGPLVCEDQRLNLTSY
jgi:hypothetical protein